MVEIEGLVRLDRPFCIGDVQISNMNYGPGPRYEYVHAWDQEHIINEGYLAPLLNLRSLGIGSTISVPWAIIKKAANDNEEEN